MLQLRPKVHLKVTGWKTVRAKEMRRRQAMKAQYIFKILIFQCHQLKNVQQKLDVFYKAI